MTSALDQLVAILDLERLEVNLFRGVSIADDRVRVFGGQVAAQALVAAGRTVESAAGQPPRAVHSLHAYFLLPGDPRLPIVYDVDRIRDGRSFTTRRVVAIQQGRPIFNLSASFHGLEDSFVHGDPMPDVPGPENVATFAEAMAPHRQQLGSWYDRPRPIDVRYLGGDPLQRTPGADGASLARAWIRADGTLGEDGLLHACVVAYASDMLLLDITLAPHGRSIWAAPDVQLASLDHAMWFHRPFRADHWLLYCQHSPTAYGGRGFAQGAIFTAEGDLAVSVAQEGLIRIRQS